MNEPDRGRETGRGQLPTTVVDVNGAPLNYYDAGEGRPIVFVHGWSLDLHSFGAQCEFFSRSHRVVAYDLRGMGKSGGGEKPYRYQRYIDDLAGLLERLGIGRAVLCGHSQGGTIALQYALDH